MKQNVEIIGNPTMAMSWRIRVTAFLSLPGGDATKEREKHTEG